MLKTLKILKILKIFLIALVTLVASNPDNPVQCPKTKCTDAKKQCTLEKTECKYTTAFEYNCKNNYDDNCPLDYTCDTRRGKCTKTS